MVAQDIYGSNIRLLYEPTILKLTDYAYILNDTTNPWGGNLWGIYVVENLLDVEETTIGFYAYPYLIKAKLHFE